MATPHYAISDSADNWRFYLGQVTVLTSLLLVLKVIIFLWWQLQQ